MRRKILSSLNVLFAKILCSKAFSIFLIATKLLSESSRFLSDAATTTPYAPYPTIFIFTKIFYNYFSTFF